MLSSISTGESIQSSLSSFSIGLFGKFCKVVSNKNLKSIKSVREFKVNEKSNQFKSVTKAILIHSSIRYTIY